MSRPKKQGLAYFPLDTGILADRKIQRLFKKYGNEGVMTYLTLLCEIYSTNGYYIEYTKDLCFDIGFTLQLGEKKIENILKFCTTIRLFDKQELIANRRITSKGIQLRYKEVLTRMRRRIPEVFSEQYSVVSSEETHISSSKTPIKGKGKGKEIKEKINTKKKNNHGDKTINDNGAAARRAELERMATEATGNSHA